MAEPLSDLAAKCIKCGFCLEACPTFVLTGDESRSPRGRINLARAADEGQIEWAETADALDTCLGCRACETACPSGVHYGMILELARKELRQAQPRPAEQALLNGITNPTIFRAQTLLSGLLPGGRVPAFVSRAITTEVAEARVPQPEAPGQWPVLRPHELPPVKGQVALLEGCVMGVLYPSTHEATRRLLRRIGFESIPATRGQCCGALHAHAGDLEGAHQRLDALAESLPPGAPLIVNAAGCGSHLKESSVGPIVHEATEFLLKNGLADLLRQSPGFATPVRVAYHDACHLAHGQGIRSAPRELIRAIPGVTLLEIEESEMCCGSAGTYNVTQPGIARQLLERKLNHVERTTPDILVSGNPGCHAWMGQGADERKAPYRVMMTVDLLETAFSGMRG